MTSCRLAKNRAGQMRILETVIAAVILFIVFSAATFLVQTSDVKVLQERSDLDRLGYNVLNSLMESGTIETIETSPLYQNWNQTTDLYLKTAVHSLLPVNIYFNLTLFKSTDMTTYVKLQPVTSNVATASPTSFTNSTEVSSTDIIYTSKNGNVYHAILLLARAGEGS
jgi:hypothetical protein